MSVLSYRLAYRKPQPGTRSVILSGGTGIPVFIALNDYLTWSDFSGITSTVSFGEEVIRATLTSTGRDKFNHVALWNEETPDIDDHSMLVLFVNGEPASQVTVIRSPIPGFEIEIRGIEPAEIRHLLAGFGGHSTH